MLDEIVTYRSIQSWYKQRLESFGQIFNAIRLVWIGGTTYLVNFPYSNLQADFWKMFSRFCNCLSKLIHAMYIHFLLLLALLDQPQTISFWCKVFFMLCQYLQNAFKRLKVPYYRKIYLWKNWHFQNRCKKLLGFRWSLVNSSAFCSVWVTHFKRRLDQFAADSKKVVPQYKNIRFKNSVATSISSTFRPNIWILQIK